MHSKSYLLKFETAQLDKLMFITFEYNLQRGRCTGSTLCLKKRIPPNHQR